MKLMLLLLFVVSSFAGAQSDLGPVPETPLEAFNRETFLSQKQKVQKDIELCKSNPDACKIANEFMFSGHDESFYRMRAKIFIRQSEFAKKHPELKGDRLTNEMNRIQRETTYDYFHFKDAAGEISLKLNDKLEDGYKPKPYYDVVPEEYQHLIDQHFLDMKSVAREIEDLGFSDKIEDWEHKQKAFNKMVSVPSCREEAIAQLLKLFKDDKKNILGKQFELTAIKTAMLLKRDAGYSKTELKSLEDFVNQQQKDFAGDDKIQELKKIYSNEAKQEDIKRLEKMTTRLKQGQYNYWDREKRILNSDISAFYLLMDKHEEDGSPSFGTEDAAVAWAFGSLAEQIKDKTSPEYSKINLSNQVNKLMSPKVAGGTDTPVEELEKMKISSEGEINQAIKETLKSKLSPECLAELDLAGEESCDASLVDLKTEAFGQMMKDISANYEKAEGPNRVAGHYGEVRDFIGKVSVNPPPKKAEKVTPENPGKKFTKRIFNGWPYEKTFFDSKDGKEGLYNQIQQYKFIKEKVKCAKDNKKCWTDKYVMMQKALTIRTTNEKFSKGVECLKLKELEDGQMLFVGEIDCKKAP